jgi:hypothetical protein
MRLFAFAHVPRSIRYCCAEERGNCRIVNCRDIAQFDVTEPFARALKHSGAVPESGTMVKAEIYMGAIHGNVGIVVGHFPWSHAETGGALSWPHDFNNIFVEPGNHLPEQFTYWSKCGLGTSHDVFEIAARVGTDHATPQRLTIKLDQTRRRG